MCGKQRRCYLWEEKNGMHGEETHSIDAEEKHGMDGKKKHDMDGEDKHDMDDEEKDGALLEDAYLYITTSAYPEGCTDSRKRVIRKKAKKFHILEGELSKSWQKD